MKKIICLLSACLFAYVSTAHARVEFIAKDGGVSFGVKSVKNTGCPAGEKNYNGICVPECKASDYPFTVCDEKKGKVTACKGVKETRCRYDSCDTKNGYVMNNKTKDCEPADCSGFPLAANEVNDKVGNTLSCISAGVTKYKYTGCYKVNNREAWNLKEDIGDLKRAVPSSLITE